MSFCRAYICISNYTDVCIVFLNEIKIDLTIQKGEKIALIGANGSGKSTILKIISKIENVSSGELSIRKGTIVGYLSQIPEEADTLVQNYIYDAFKNLIEMKKN